MLSELQATMTLTMTKGGGARSAEWHREVAAHHVRRLVEIGDRLEKRDDHQVRFARLAAAAPQPAFAREQNLLLTTHLAESDSEFQMFTDSRGPFFDWLKGQRNMADCGKGSPVQLAHEYGLLGPNLVAVHANYLASGDKHLTDRSSIKQFLVEASLIDRPEISQRNAVGEKAGGQSAEL